MYELALFAGAGGGILGGKLLGWTTVCAVELDEYARRVLLARQDDGCLEPFPIWSDVCTFDGRPWRGVVDIVTGGFPCQDISAAGKGAGIDGARSGLWKEMGRIIGEVRPGFVLVENSPVLTSRGLGVVLGDLAEMGYDAVWGVLGAIHTGAPHRRERIWILGADANLCGRIAGSGVEREHEDLLPRFGAASQNLESGRGRECGAGEVRATDVADSDGGRLEQCDEGQRSVSKSDESGAAANQGGAVHDPNGGRHEPPQGLVCAGRDGAECAGWWRSEPDVGRVAHGVAARVDRLRCTGNGQVSAVVRLAWRLLAPKE